MTEQERAGASEEAYQTLRRQLDQRLRTDPRLRKITAKITDGAADFQDTAEYSEIVANHIGAVLQENIGTITNPLGKEYVCKELLRDHYDTINDVLGEVQIALDEELGIHLTPQKAPYPAQRAAQVAHALEDPTVKPETIRRRANAPVANVAKSFHDDYIKVNARVRNDLGLKPTITRFGAGCCAWCSAVAGKYRFGEQPQDIFRRHDNCNCTIIYDTQVLRGSRTEDGGRSKTWEEVDPDSITGTQPQVLSQEQAENLQNSALHGLTFAGKRDIITGRGSGTGSESGAHTFEKIGEVDPHDKKAVASLLTEFERKYKNSEIEHCRVITSSGEVYEVHGGRYTVDTTLLGDLMHGSTNEHNHVTGESQYSFSWDDLRESAKDGSEIVIAFDEKYRYFMSFLDTKISEDTLYDAYQEATEEVHDARIFGADIPDNDMQHEIVKRACEKVGIVYDRRKR